jgi:hypothetical protein
MRVHGTIEGILVEEEVLEEGTHRDAHKKVTQGFHLRLIVGGVGDLISKRTT